MHRVNQQTEEGDTRTGALTLSPVCVRGPWSRVHRSVCTVRSPVSVCVPTREPEGSRAPPVHTPLLWTTGTRYQPKSVKFVTRAERARVSWISSGHNLSQVWPGEVGGTNPQGHQAPESSLEKGGSLGRPNKVRRRKFIALPGYLSRIIMIEVEEPEVQPGRDLNRVKTPLASRTHWFR